MKASKYASQIIEKRNTKAFPYWPLLAPEIRLMILERLPSCETLGRHQIAGYAAVCKEWQSWVEARTFSLILIDSGDRLDDLAYVVRGARVSCVKCIRLHVELSEYSEAESKVAEHDGLITDNNRRFSEQLRALFATLSTWESATDITVELGASSISDVLTGKFAVENDDLVQDWGLLPDDDPKDNPEKMQTIKRLLGNPLDLLDDENGENGLCPVPAVKCLVVNRGHFRTLGERALTAITSSLPHLEKIMYEPWEFIEEEGQNQVDDATTALLNHLGASAKELALKELTLWEAAHPQIHNHFVSFFDKELACAAARASFQLESLSVSDMIDAKQFFDYMYSSGIFRDNDQDVWPKLRSICLTSAQLQWKKGEADANVLLLRAGAAALRMPKLELMELWYSKQGEGFVFRYDARGDEAKIHIASSWDFELKTCVAMVFRQVAWRRMQWDVSFSFEKVDPESLTGYYNMCERLQSTVRCQL